MEHVGFAVRSRQAGLALGSLALFLLSIPGLPVSARAAVVDEATLDAEGEADAILPGVFRLQGIAPGPGTSDLEPLRQWIGKANLVGLGESIHTSGGYHTAKHRVVRFLVERLGFRALAIESSWASAESVNAYVTTCQGSAEEALRGLDAFWQSAEVRDLVEWMCQWNRTHRRPKDRLTFFGFDIQQPEADGPALIEFLGRIGVADGDPLSEGVRRCDGVAGPRAPAGAVPQEANAACLEALAAIDEKFVREARTIVKRTSKKDFDWAKVRLAGLRGWQSYSFFLRADPVQSDEARDGAMAFVLRASQPLRLPPKTKVAAWAHNFHLSKAPLDDPNGFARTMGTFLREALGAGYFVVGLIGWDIGVDAPPGLCGTRQFSSAGSLEARLHELGEDVLLVDSRISSSVLTPGEPVEVSGSVIVPVDHYNALLFLDDSPRMTPLHRPPC